MRRRTDLAPAPFGLRRICELIELDFDPGMLDHQRGAKERLDELGDLPAWAAARRARGPSG